MECFKVRKCLEGDHLSLPLLVTSELESFASLDGKLSLYLAFGAFQLQYDLLCGLGLVRKKK